MEIGPFAAFRGVVTDVRSAGGNPEQGGCLLIYRLENEEGSLAEFLITPDTYFLHQVRVELGMSVVGFYDVNAPMVLSFPPRYRPMIVALDDHKYNIKVDTFDERLLSADGELMLHIGPDTEIRMENGQDFIGDLPGKLLMVLYGVTTRSIPAQTTPEEIIVFCRT